MEVYNQVDRFPNCRAIWDNVNSKLMPNRPVWGYANDDSHGDGHLYHGFNIFLMPVLDESSLRTAMNTGAFYFCYEPAASGDALTPSIESIIVNEVAKTITIISADYDTIDWVSAGTTTIETGDIFNYSDFKGNFVRAVLTNSHGYTHTQPFGFSVEESMSNVYAKYNNSIVKIGEIWARSDGEIKKVNSVSIKRNNN